LELFNKLREVRMTLSKEFKVPPYVIFSDATLRDMARYLPETKQDFLNIKGIGEKKYKQIGEQFNAILTQWIKDHTKEDKTTKINQLIQQFNSILTHMIKDHPKEDTAIQINQDHFKQPTEKNELPSHRETYKLFQSGNQIKDIASMRDLTEQTIENHLFKCYKEGFFIPWNIFLSDTEEKEILEVKNTLPDSTLKALKEELSEAHTYTKIKAALVKNNFY